MIKVVKLYINNLNLCPGALRKNTLQLENCQLGPFAVDGQYTHVFLDSSKLIYSLFYVCRILLYLK